jgi:hypothetical protein
MMKKQLYTTPQLLVYGDVANITRQDEDDDFEFDFDDRQQRRGNFQNRDRGSNFPRRPRHPNW